jgi:hypothetical protein
MEAMFNDPTQWAYRALILAENDAFATEDGPCTKSALSYLGNASTFVTEFPPEDVARALRVVDEVVRTNCNCTIPDVMRLYGRFSNLGDACAARLIAHVTVKRNVFGLCYRLASKVGPRALRELLRAGADPNQRNGTQSPLDEVMLPTLGRLPDHRFEMALLLVAAGADPEGVSPATRKTETFRRLCDLRKLSVLYSCLRPTHNASPAVRFVAQDGDLAIAHSVHEFLAPRDLFVSQ